MTMYRHIYVPVDNSEHSQAASTLAVTLGRAFGARLTGCHVYAARLHDARFRQMEYTLPETYRQESELERQRQIHDSLIAMGLRLISESYLEALARQARAAGLAFEGRALDGKHHRALAEDVGASDCDLVVMGALGMGAVKDSQIGSVAERFIRRTTTDTLVVRRLDPSAPGAIVVAVDGSPQSFHALRIGIAFAKALGRPLEAVAAFDPYLHYALFKSIAGVLSAEAAQVFRFKEQEQLHEEIIDSGLAQIYRSHLEIGARLAREAGVDLATRLLAGKCYEKLLQHCRATEPWLLVLGRVGIHSDGDERELGSNAENLLRLAPCSVLLTGGQFQPPAEARAETMMAWTEEARARMERVPAPFRGVARAALLRYAMEQGHTVVTSRLVDEAMTRFMPGMAGRIRGLARDLAVARLRGEGAGPAPVCSRCGYVATGPGPVARCPACGTDGLLLIDRAAIEAEAAREGGVEEEEVLPGVSVRWTAEARAGLDLVVDPTLRDRVKSRIEKHARARRMPAISRDLALPLILEALGRPSGDAAAVTPPPAPAPAAPAVPAPSWTAEALARLARVPEGFMRDMSREEIEALARRRGRSTVDLALCEEWIAHARETMCPAPRAGSEAGA
jgi:nucleotide-binding universal stress UspA family protein